MSECHPQNATSYITQLSDEELQSQLESEQPCVVVFDFDGVLASRFEDDIYKLAVAQNEPADVVGFCRSFNLNFDEPDRSYTSLNDVRYRRHAVYQAAALRCGTQIQPGPFFNTARFCETNQINFVWE